MNEHLGREARELIDRARREEAVAEPEELRQIRKRVLAAASGSAVLGTVGKALALDGGSRLGLSALLKAGLVGSGTGAVAVGVSLMMASPAASPTGASDTRTTMARSAPANGHTRALGERETTPSPVLEVLPSSGVSAALPELAAAGSSAPRNERSKSPVPQAPRAAQPSTETTTATAPARRDESETLAPELALLERVQAELRAGNGARALRLLDDSAGAIEHSPLRAERLAAEVFAACQAGDRERARRVMNRFLLDYPNSPSTARVRASCAGTESVE